MNRGETAPERQDSVLAVILNWNGASDTLRCVRSVLDQTGVKPHVLVVDNGSSDDSLLRLGQAGLPIEILPLAENVGFTGGMNAGAKRAIPGGFEFTWLVNNDAFPAPGCLTSLLDCMRRDPRAVMAAPRLLSADGTEQPAGGTIDWSTGECSYLNAADLGRPLTADQWLTGAAPLVRTSAFAGADLLEPAFFAYMEDVDLSIRLARAGGTLYAGPGAEVLHVGGSTSGGPTSPVAQFLYSRNAWLLLKRHSPRGADRAIWLRFAASTVQRAALYELNGGADLANAVMAAVSAARRNEFGPPPASLRPALLEKLIAKWPWRSIRVMNALARGAR